MRLNKRFAALILSSAMIMSMNVGVGAATTTPAPETNVLKFQNILHMDKNTTNPAAKYAYNIEGVEGEESAVIPQIQGKNISTENAVAPSATPNDFITDVEFTFDNPSELGITHAGEYEFKLVETPDSTNTVDELNDPQEYKILVTAKNDGDTISVNHVFVYNEDGEKVEPVFEEAYVDYGEFTVSKNVVGEYADRSKEFSFSLSINKPTVSANVSENYVVTKYAKDGSASTITDFTNFKLADGEYIKVTGVAIGSTYDVTETVDPEYDPAIALTEGGQKTGSGDGSVISSVFNKEALVLYDENAADYTNTHNKEITVTGVVMNNAPFIVMILAGVAAIAAFTLLGYKRRH